MSDAHMIDGRQIKILIAEDDTSLMEIMNMQLSKKGFDVLTATNGKKAVEVAEKETPDIILLDLLMPEMDGFEVLQNLRDKSITIPTIVLTNLGQEENCDRSKELGAVDCCVKSDTPLTTLEENILQVLQSTK